MKNIKQIKPNLHFEKNGICLNDFQNDKSHISTREEIIKPNKSIVSLKIESKAHKRRGKVFTDYYKGQLLTDAKRRYDVTHSAGSHPIFETVLINHRKFNIEGLSFIYSPRPPKFKGNLKRLAEMIIGRDSFNISSVYVPNIEKNYVAFGDVNTTNDALIVFIDSENKSIELFIARGLKNDRLQLYTAVCAGYYEEELYSLRQSAINRIVN